jgi:hypothetical protein
MLISLKDAHAAGLLRVTPGIEACVAGDALCLRGAALTDSLEALLRQIPGERFCISPEHALIPHNRSLPVRGMPEGEWRPIAEVLAPQIPPTCLPGQSPAMVPFKLAPASEEVPANFMLMPWETWSAWATSAPAVRLRPLRFAMSVETAAVHGSPLPNVRGPRYVVGNGIAIPCGYKLAPDVPLPIIAEAMGLAGGDIAIFGPDGSYDLLRAEVFVPATRASVRLSVEALGLAEGRA